MAFPRQQRPVAERLWIAARPWRHALSGARIASEDHWLFSEGGWKLFARVHAPLARSRESRPAGDDEGSSALGWRAASRPRDLPAVLVVPGLGGTARSVERWRQPVNAYEVAALGCVVMALDLSGRGRSWGSESYGGPENHGDVRAALRELAALPGVDPDRIGVISLSLGCAAVAGALASGDRPAVSWWIDWEGPSDREIITAGGRLMDPAQGHGLDDDRYWYPREAVRFVGHTGVPYLRYQSARDHAQPGETRHASRMIAAAAAGTLPWFQLNDEPRGATAETWADPGLRPARKWMHARVRELHALP